MSARDTTMHPSAEQLTEPGRPPHSRHRTSRLDPPLPRSAAIAGMLSGAVAPLAADTVDLQRLAGNASVGGLISSHAVVQRQDEVGSPVLSDAPVAAGGPHLDVAGLFKPLTMDDLWRIERPDQVNIDLFLEAEAGARAAAESPFQIQVSYGRATEAHTRAAGPGAPHPAVPTTDVQDQLTAAVVVQLHRPNQPGGEVAFQGQMNWDPLLHVNADAVSQLSGLQAGVQASLVSAVWHRVQASIYLQVMGGVATGEAGANPQLQGSGGGQLTLQLTENLQLFTQVGGGGTVTGGPAGPSGTGDVSATVGVTGTF
jgi:hypothetical protein